MAQAIFPQVKTGFGAVEFMSSTASPFCVIIAFPATNRKRIFTLTTFMRHTGLSTIDAVSLIAVIKGADLGGRNNLRVDPVFDKSSLPAGWLNVGDLGEVLFSTRVLRGAEHFFFPQAFDFEEPISVIMTPIYDLTAGDPAGTYMNATTQLSVSGDYGVIQGLFGKPR